MVGKFIETEDKNFALFNYVNELNNNIEFLQEQIADMESNIKQFKQETIEMDDKRQKILKNMEVSFICFLMFPPRSLVVNDLRSKTKGCRFKSVY